MTRMIILIRFGLAVALTSCNPNSTSTDATALTQNKIETNLYNITELRIPNSATNISGVEMSLFTYVFDCTFECSKSDLESAWNNSEKLLEKAPLKGFGIVSNEPTQLIDDSWPSEKGTQFVNISITKLGEDQLRVDVLTTHE